MLKGGDQRTNRESISQLQYSILQLSHVLGTAGPTLSFPWLLYNGTPSLGIQNLHF